jgi:hypothetical protein
LAEFGESPIGKTYEYDMIYQNKEERRRRRKKETYRNEASIKRM